MGPSHRVTWYIGGISQLPVVEMSWGKNLRKSLVSWTTFVFYSILKSQILIYLMTPIRSCVHESHPVNDSPWWPRPIPNYTKKTIPKKPYQIIPNHTKPYQFWKYKVREVLDHRNDNTRSLPYQDTVHLTIDFGDCKKTEVLVLIGSFLKYWQNYYTKLGPLVDIKVAWSSKAKWYAGGKSAKFTNDEKHGRGGVSE